METVYVDGQGSSAAGCRRCRRTPTRWSTSTARSASAPGANDPHLRLKDLDQEGVWAEATYPSIGVWSCSIRTPEVVAAGARAINDWVMEFQSVSPSATCARR